MGVVFGKRFVLAAISLGLILTACGSSSHAGSGADAAGKAKTTVLPHWYTTRFAGFFPPVGARPTLPAHGKLLLEIPSGSVYADGHITTDRGVQRLTPWGARLLWSKVRAIGLAADMFRHNWFGQVESRHRIYGWYAVCSGRRLIHAQVGTTHHPTNPKAPARGRALARIDTLFANATSRLPAKAWADRTIHPYAPSHYTLAFDHPGPDAAKLPSPASEELARLLHSPWQLVTTDQAWSLIKAFAKAGVKPLPRSGEGELDFRLPADADGDSWFGDKYAVLRVGQDEPPDGGPSCEYSGP